MGDEPVDFLLDDDPAVRRVAWHRRPRSLTPALAAGAMAFLSKPVDGDTLLSRVEQAPGRR